MLKLLYQKISNLVPMDFTRVLLWKIETGHSTGTNTSEEKALHVHCCQVTESQLQRYVDLPGYELSSAVVQSVSHEDVMCFGVYVENTLAGYVFFCNSPVYAQRNSGGSAFTGIGLSFPDHVRYLYKMLVLPEYRGQKLSAKLIRFAASALAGSEAGKAVSEQKGTLVSHIVTTTDWTNTSFLNVTAAIGFESKGIAGEYIILGKRGYVLPRAIALPDGADAIVLSKP